MKVISVLLTTAISLRSMLMQQNLMKAHIMKCIKTEKSATPKVTEVFLFSLPTLLQLRTAYQSVKNFTSKDAQFEKVHVAFMGKDMAIPMAKSYATMVTLGVEDSMVTCDVLKQIHQALQRTKR